MGVPTVTSSTAPRRFAGLVLVGALGAASLLAACGDDDAGSSDTTEAPEDVQAPMDEVLTGLDKMLGYAEEAGTAAAAGDFDAVLSKYDELHDVWRASRAR
jgi:hypothetical protein